MDCGDTMHIPGSMRRSHERAVRGLGGAAAVTSGRPARRSAPGSATSETQPPCQLPARTPPPPLTNGVSTVVRRNRHKFGTYSEALPSRSRPVDASPATLPPKTSKFTSRDRFGDPFPFPREEDRRRPTRSRTRPRLLTGSAGDGSSIAIALPISGRRGPARCIGLLCAAPRCCEQ